MARSSIGRVLLAFALAATGITVASPASHAASRWCGGTDETAADRPDTVGGNQIHVVYAHANDVPDRFADVAPLIVGDLEGVDAWWRGQDPTRAPRFDFAAFPGCDSRFGNLDLSVARLADRGDQLAALSGRDYVLRVGDDIANALVHPRSSELVTATAETKAYLVYLDAPVPASSTGQCGVTAGPASLMGPRSPAMVFLQPALEASGSCGLGSFGSGNGYPAVTAAHELVHKLDMPMLGRPHPCFLDLAHVCDNRYDLLFGAATTISSLDERILDVGHDDYYGVGGGSDVRNSPWLAHLDSQQFSLGVSIDANRGGVVESSPSAIQCPDVCTLPWDAGSVVTLLPVPDAGFAFGRWTGGCATSSSSCTLTINSDTQVVARFVPLIDVSIRAIGPGTVVNGAGEMCAHRCTWKLPEGRTYIVAAPDTHSRFEGWRGPSCRGVRPRCKLTVRAGARGIAVFAPA